MRANHLAVADPLAVDDPQVAEDLQAEEDLLVVEDLQAGVARGLRAGPETARIRRCA